VLRSNYEVGFDDFRSANDGFIFRKIPFRRDRDFDGVQAQSIGNGLKSATRALPRFILQRRAGFSRSNERRRIHGRRQYVEEFQACAMRTSQLRGLQDGRHRAVGQRFDRHQDFTNCGH